LRHESWLDVAGVCEKWQRLQLPQSRQPARLRDREKTPQARRKVSKPFVPDGPQLNATAFARISEERNDCVFWKVNPFQRLSGLIKDLRP